MRFSFLNDQSGFSPVRRRLLRAGMLALTVIRQTLQQPIRHVIFVAGLITLVTAFGWALGLAIGSIAVVLILLGASAFGPRHVLFVWTAVVVFVTGMIALFGFVDSFATTIRNIPSGASGAATASRVLGAFDTPCGAQPEG